MATQIGETLKSAWQHHVGTTKLDVAIENLHRASIEMRETVDRRYDDKGYEKPCKKIEPVNGSRTS